MHAILRGIVNMVLNSEECGALQRYIVLKREIMTTAAASLDIMRDDARKMVSNMVEMERSYLTAEVFREILASSHAVDELSEEIQVRAGPSLHSTPTIPPSAGLATGRAGSDALSKSVFADLRIISSEKELVFDNSKSPCPIPLPFTACLFKLPVIPHALVLRE